MTDPEGSRLSRWSRKKLETKRLDETVEEAPDTPEPEAVDAVEDDPELIAALPPLDEITADFDMAPFLAKGIPAHLKNAAFRRLWQASPAVRDYLDPAVDYAWDWNAPGGVPGGGGVLSEQSVAKMVKDLVGERSQDAEDLTADAAGDDEVASAPAPHEPEPAPVAVRRGDTQPAPEPAPEEETEAPHSAEQVAQLPQRRHGGAVPE